RTSFQVMEPRLVWLGPVTITSESGRVSSHHHKSRPIQKSLPIMLPLYTIVFLYLTTDSLISRWRDQKNFPSLMKTSLKASGSSLVRYRRSARPDTLILLSHRLG